VLILSKQAEQGMAAASGVGNESGYDANGRLFCSGFRSLDGSPGRTQETTGLFLDFCIAFIYRISLIKGLVCALNKHAEQAKSSGRAVETGRPADCHSAAQSRSLRCNGRISGTGMERPQQFP